MSKENTAAAMDFVDWQSCYGWLGINDDGGALDPFDRAWHFYYTPAKQIFWRYTVISLSVCPSVQKNSFSQNAGGVLLVNLNRTIVT